MDVDEKVVAMRRLLVVLALVVGLVVADAGCANPLRQPNAPVGSTPTASAALIAMPDVVSQNAAVAVDKLKRLGFTNIDLGTVDGRPMVVLPQNWTVKTQSAKPGDQLAADAKIVLGCTKNG